VRRPRTALSVAAITRHATPYETLDDVERALGSLRAVDRRLVALYLDRGLSSRQCARELFLSPSAVLRRLDALGIARRAPGGSRPRLSERQLRRVAFLYERLGLSLAAIAEMEGVHPNAVRHRLRAAGVALRPRGPVARAA
jgi:DNA-directed RNA polymerase specialized sigma24 family protein